MGDQFCSMTYSLTHFYYVGCLYSSGWQNQTVTCNLQKNWISGILLASTPLFIRFIQCLKRYADSKNYIHLINGGKYCTGYVPLIPLLLLVKTLSRSVIAISVFFNWRAHGQSPPKLIMNRLLISYLGMNYDTHFIVWILFNTAYAVYASAWASFSDSMMIIFH